MTLMNPLGTMVGFVIPFAFINPDDPIKQIKEGFLFLMMSQAIVAGVVFFLTLLFFKGEKELSRKKPQKHESPRVSDQHSFQLGSVTNMNANQ